MEYRQIVRGGSYRAKLFIFNEISTIQSIPYEKVWLKKSPTFR